MKKNTTLSFTHHSLMLYHQNISSSIAFSLSNADNTLRVFAPPISLSLSLYSDCC